MAVTANAKDTVLVVNYQVGTNPTTGAPQLRQRSFQNVKASALDQDVYDIANAIFGLQQYPVTGVRRDNRIDLAE